MSQSVPPSDADRLLAEARAALADGRPDAAAAAAKAAENAGAGGAEPHWLAALGLAAGGNARMAAVSAGRADGYAPGDARGALVRACVAAFAGETEEAAVRARGALARDPAFAAAHAVLAGLAAVARDWDAADRHAAAGLAADPGHAACERLAELAGDPLDRDDPAACGAAVLAAFTPTAADLTRGPETGGGPITVSGWQDPHAEDTVKDAAREILGRWLPGRRATATAG